MSSRTIVRALHRGLFVVLTVALYASLFSIAQAGNYRNSAVGGIIISETGVVRNAVPEEVGALVKQRSEELKKASGEMSRAVPIRKISLKALEAACRHYVRDESAQLPDEVRYLGGLQRIQYVLVYPDQHDIVLAGPAEGWKVDDQGDVVGVTTGRPVLQLDDLLVALRTINTVRHGGITCSIDPTPEGRRNLLKLLSQQQKTRGNRNLPALEQAMKQAFGPQQVSLRGVPADSHFARVLVAADYRMKRLAMNLDPSPIAGLPSYLAILKSSGTASSNVNPRWWLAANYQPMGKSADGLSWHLRGQGVKCLTEEEVIDAQGGIQGTGRTSPAASRWANLMTEKFEQLAAKETIFGQLRNIMDLCVVAALIDQNDLCGQADCNLPMLSSGNSDLITTGWFAPREIQPECSFLRSHKRLIVTASGGVQINPFAVVTQSEVDNQIQQLHKQAATGKSTSWWWN